MYRTGFGLRLCKVVCEDSLVNWPSNRARRKFGALVRDAQVKGPQIVTYRGTEAVVVVSAAEYRRLTAPKPSLKEFLLSGPYFDDLDIVRSRDLPRAVDLGFDPQES